MITSGRNLGLPERSTFLGGKIHQTFKKMPILSQLSRRFHDMLTTDAKADPPRTGSYLLVSSTANKESTKTESESIPASLEKEQEDITSSIHRQKSIPEDARPTTPTDFYTKPDLDKTRSTNESREPKRPRMKAKSKYSKHSQGANIVNYHIVNSNGVKIGSRTSYICNINQYSANNNEGQFETASKPKHRSMPENVQKLSTCEEELGFDDMLIIKTHIGHGWRDIARRLSYSDGQIDQFEENYRHKGIDEVIYQLLLDWKQANTRDAQLGMLVSILWSCQEYDCVDRLAAARKNPS